MRALPPTSEIQIAAPEAPGPVQPEGRETAEEEAAASADEAEAETEVTLASAEAETLEMLAEAEAEMLAMLAEPVVAVKSELRLGIADETAKRVSELGPPQIDFASPEQVMLH